MTYVVLVWFMPTCCDFLANDMVCYVHLFSLRYGLFLIQQVIQLRLLFVAFDDAFVGSLI